MARSARFTTPNCLEARATSRRAPALPSDTSLAAAKNAPSDKFVSSFGPQRPQTSHTPVKTRDVWLVRARRCRLEAQLHRPEARAPSTSQIAVRGHVLFPAPGRNARDAGRDRRGRAGYRLERRLDCSPCPLPVMRGGFSPGKAPSAYSAILPAVEFAACDCGCRAIPRRNGQMVKRLLKGVLFSVMVVWGALALSTFAQTSGTDRSTTGTTGATGAGASGTGGSSTSGTGTSQGSSTSGSSTYGTGSSGTSGSSSIGGSMGGSTEPGTGGGADAGRKGRDAGY